MPNPKKHKMNPGENPVDDPKPDPQKTGDQIPIPDQSQAFPKDDGHKLAIKEAKEFAANWTLFKTEFDQLLHDTSNPLLNYDSHKLIERINMLRKYAFINYETFEFKNNSIFKDRLVKMIQSSDSLQIVFGMRGVEPDYAEMEPMTFEGRSLMSCVILVARDDKGKVIQRL